MNAAMAKDEELLRMTPLRREVFDLIATSSRPIKAYDLLRALATRRGRVAPPTIYRTLNYLVNAGLVHRIECLNAFSACPHAAPECEHVFLICEGCQNVTEVGASKAVRALRLACATAGFEPEQFTQEVRGICAACRASSKIDSRNRQTRG